MYVKFFMENIFDFENYLMETLYVCNVNFSTEIGLNKYGVMLILEHFGNQFKGALYRNHRYHDHTQSSVDQI